MTNVSRLIFFLVIFAAFISALRRCQVPCGPRIRKSWQELTSAEQQLFINALQQAYKNGVYQLFTSVHKANFPIAHSTSTFFPWHRWFLFQFENYLRSLGGPYSCITIPYWGWETTSTSGITYILNAEHFGSPVSGCIPDGPFKNWTLLGVNEQISCIERDFPSGVSLCGQACIQNIILSNSEYGVTNGFRTYFEINPHAGPHNWVGGNMATTASCNDPLFFVHHSNVDRLWALWQDCWDHDEVPESSLSTQQYTSHPVGAYPIDGCMSFGESTFLRSPPRCITPRMMHRIQGNSLVPEMSYSYTDDTRLIPLLNSSGRCNWHWQWPFTISSLSVPSSLPPRPAPLPKVPPVPTPEATTVDPCTAAAENCTLCTALATCGWCSDKCVTGTNNGPKSGSTCSPTWAWLSCPNGDEPLPPTPALPASNDTCLTHTNCAACTSQASCGWCERTGQCITGTSNGQIRGTCPSGWSWRSYQCDCNSMTSCDLCISLPVCGWCSNSKCSIGSSAGPTGTTCNDTYSTWSWTSCSKKRSREQLPNIPKIDIVNISVKLDLDLETLRRVSNKARKIVGEFFNEAYGSRRPAAPPGYVDAPEKFRNPQVQIARERIDDFYGPEDFLNRIRGYYIAECMIEGVSAYVTDDWISRMKMERNRSIFLPPCFNETLPVDIELRA